MKILGRIFEVAERLKLVDAFKSASYITICKKCGAIFSFDQNDVIQKGTAHIICPCCTNDFQIPKKYVSTKNKVENKKSGCSCAYRTDQYHGWGCSITEGACMFLYPNSKACAEEYGEGPDVKSEPLLHEQIIELYEHYVLDKSNIMVLDQSLMSNCLSSVSDIVSDKGKFTSDEDKLLVEFIHELIVSSYIDDPEDIAPAGYVSEFDLEQLDQDILLSLSLDLGFKYEEIDDIGSELYGLYAITFTSDSIILKIQDKYMNLFKFNNEEEE